MSVELKELRDIDSDKMFLDPRPIEVGDKGEVCYLIVFLEWTSGWDVEYDIHVSIVAVSPQMAIIGNLKDFLQTYGIDRQTFDGFPLEGQLEFLVESGCKATLWQITGNEDDEVEIMEQAKEEIAKINMLAGFYLDRPQNKIGATGWDWLSGYVSPQ